MYQQQLNEEGWAAGAALINDVSLY